MKLQIPAGTTSKRIALFIQDSSSTTGAGLTGLAFGSAGLSCYSWIDTDGNANGTAQALQTATRGTWTTRGFIEKDATNLPGFYEFGVPDALLAAGVKWATLLFKGATNMAPLPLEIEVTAISNQDGVRGGMSALPNAAAEAAGGLYTRGAGAGQITQSTNGQIDVDAKKWNSLTTVALPLVPTTAGRTLDVSAGGEAGMDWANVGGATTANALTNTSIASVSGAVGSVTGAVGSVTAGVTVTTNNDKTGYGLSAAAVQAIWDALTSALTTVGSIGKRIADFLTGDAYVRLGAPAGASTAADIAAVNAKTTNLPASPAAVGSAMTLTSGERTSIADAWLDRDMSVGTDSGSPTVRTPRQALRFNRNKWSIAAGTLTVTKEDDATASWTAAVTTSVGNPVSTIDPA